MRGLAESRRTAAAGVAVQKTSLIDFPGRVSSVLFFAGCNFRCPYCHNPDLVRPPFPDDLGTLEEALSFLETRRSVLSGVVLSGGEPLVWEGLPNLAEELRGRGFKVKLDTNGSFPDRIEDVGADYVALDLKTAPDRYDRVAPGVPDAGAKVLESLRVVRSLGVPYELRITCAPGVAEPEDIRVLAELLLPEDSVALQGFRPLRVLDPRWGSFPATPERLLEEYARELGKRAARVRIRSSF
ncbi:MAG: anaerobic ribonucleoside-triphosphate reductase activating protein [Treponema sp.]|nr:anaerobic ribonucleoside-triphosphate reductase activating protein [Treponema sp.]